MHNYNTIITFFDEYITHYRELLSFENIKLEMIVSNNVLELSSSLSKEQALIMKGNSLESKRLKLFEKEGFKNIKFQKLIDEAPQEYSSMLNTKFIELSKYINEVKRINDNGLSIVKEKLAKIEAKSSNKTSDTYDGKGGKKHSSAMPSAISKNF